MICKTERRDGDTSPPEGVDAGTFRGAAAFAWVAFCLMLLSLAPPPVSGQAPASEERDSPVGQRARIAGDRMIADVTLLAHDSLEGRRIGTVGSERARRFLVRAFDTRGVARLNGERTRSFEFSGRGATAAQTGVNVLGVVPGAVTPDR
jgi:hypothetical protein